MSRDGICVRHVTRVVRGLVRETARNIDGNAIGLFGALEAKGRLTDGREHFHDLYAWDEFWS